MGILHLTFLIAPSPRLSLTLETALYMVMLSELAVENTDAAVDAVVASVAAVLPAAGGGTFVASLTAEV